MGAPVQTNEASAAASATTIAVAQGSNPTVGNVNMVWVRGPSAATVTGVADTLGHTYTARGNVTEAGTGQVLYQFTAPITSTGANTVTATYGGSTSNRGITVMEGVGTYDASNTGTDTGNNPTTAVSATNSAQPATLYMLCNDVQGGTPGVGTGFTNIGTGWATLGLNYRAQYKTVTTVASQSGDFSNAGFDRCNTGLIILLDASAPAITVQPADQTVNDGATANFSVTATGATSYQWKKNGSNVGTNSSSYSLTATYADQSAQITVDCINGTGTTTSSAATLRVEFNLAGTGQRSQTSLGNGAFGAGTFEAIIRGTDTGGGSTIESRTLSSAGVGAASFTSQATNAQTLTSTGVATPSFVAAAINLRTLSSAGVGAANWSSALVTAQPFTSAGVAAASWTAASVLPVSLSSAGVAAPSFVSQAINGQALTSSGVGAASWAAVSIAQVALSSAGVAAASWDGVDANGGATIESRTLSAAGVGAASFTAAQINSVSLASAGIGAAAFQSAATVASQLASAGVGAFVVQSAEIHLRTFSSAGVGAATFDGTDGNVATIESRTLTADGAATATFDGRDANAIVIPGVGFQDFAAAGGVAKRAEKKAARVKAPPKKATLDQRIEARELTARGAASVLFDGLAVQGYFEQRGLLRTEPVSPYPQLLRASCSHCGAPMSAHRQP